MHLNRLFPDGRVFGRAQWPFRRLAWLACWGVLWSFGLALIAAQIQPGQAQSVHVSGAVESVGMDDKAQSIEIAGMLTRCADSPSHGSCTDAEPNDASDQEVLLGLARSFPLIRVMRPAWEQGLKVQAMWQPLLRPPCCQG